MSETGLDCGVDVAQPNVVLLNYADGSHFEYCEPCGAAHRHLTENKPAPRSPGSCPPREYGPAATPDNPLPDVLHFLGLQAIPGGLAEGRTVPLGENHHRPRFREGRFPAPGRLLWVVLDPEQRLGVNRRVGLAHARGECGGAIGHAGAGVVRLLGTNHQRGPAAAPDNFKVTFRVAVLEAWIFVQHGIASSAVARRSRDRVQRPPLVGLGLGRGPGRQGGFWEVVTRYFKPFRWADLICHYTLTKGAA